MMLAPQRALARPSANADTWGRYYTLPSVSDALVGAIQVANPELIVELGVGQGAISSVAAKRWKNAKLVTVDRDFGALPIMSGRSRRAHEHFVYDALETELPSKIGVPLGSADIALCNPPYVRPRWRAAYGTILEEAGLAGSLDSVHDAGADLLFIAQNLRLLRQSGKLGLILPDGLLTGEKYARVRATLLREHRIDEVIQLPRTAFAKADAQTHLMVLTKSAGSTKNIKLRQLSTAGFLSQPLVIDADVGKLRLDYSYHAAGAGDAQVIQDGNKPLSYFALALKRGSFNSAQLGMLPVPIFHLSDFPEATRIQLGVVPRKFIRSAKTLASLPLHANIACDGDILLARIGRNLHTKICVVQGGACLISDCIYALRVLPQYRNNVLSFLNSEAGRVALQSAAHGVGARFLSRANLLNVTLPNIAL
ncbi:N-6 DNA methylase [Pseudoduganella armeniaca]|uniref:DNA methylase adenine-specific domain-containing protein n=1 Tax=Pseudoduganella armeniaca TaxID=2072590 RepID=A0A2R4CG93_9BURK|nr:N-6 DNA methylase [Pseudoduganella armeniaca]AVR98649.1 hypothetical protein C9I28_25705 [Pseudoduganella armeniaca]